MSIQDITFEETLDVQGDRHLLLGNGFGRSLDPVRFDFETLFEKAAFSDSIQQFVSPDTTAQEGLGTYPDFERTLRSIRDTEVVLDHLGVTVPDNLGDLETTIKNGLIKAVHAVHEVVGDDGDVTGYITSFSAEQVLSCGKFLKHFQSQKSKIFTLNYDLLLYRVLMELKNPNSSLGSDMRERLSEEGIRLSDWGDALFRGEGERKCYWQSWASSPSPRVYYLHGALHLFEDSVNVYKEEGQGEGLLGKLDQHISAGQIPLFVSEGTSNRKRSRIFGNDYLKDCFEKLGQVSDNIFIYGCSLDGRDTHIWSQIDNTASLGHVFVGYFGADEKDQIIERIKRSFPNKVGQRGVSVFDTSCINPWR
jgi:hypothetical protein